MARIRRCDSRCHHAKGTRCACWCGGQFHGSQGASARAVLMLAPSAMPPQFVKGKTAFILQEEFPPTLSWDD